MIKPPRDTHQELAGRFYQVRNLVNHLLTHVNFQNGRKDNLSGVQHHIWIQVFSNSTKGGLRSTQLQSSVVQHLKVHNKGTGLPDRLEDQ